MRDLDKKLVQAIDRLLPEAGLYDKERAGDSLIIEPELRHLLWALGRVGYEPCKIVGCALYDSDAPSYDLTKSLFSQLEETKQWLLGILT